MHSPAQKNALVQHKVFEKVHVVNLKLGLNSGRAKKDTHPTAAGCFHHKEIPPVCSCVLSQLHNSLEPIQQVTAQTCKATNISFTSPSALQHQEHADGRVLPCFTKLWMALEIALALNTHWAQVRQSGLCFVILI